MSRVRHVAIAVRHTRIPSVGASAMALCSLLGPFAAHAGPCVDVDTVRQGADYRITDQILDDLIATGSLSLVTRSPNRTNPPGVAAPACLSARSSLPP